MGSNVRMRRRSKKGSSSEAPTQILKTLVWSVRMVEPTYSDTHCTTKFIHQRGLQGDKLVNPLWCINLCVLCFVSFFVSFQFFIADDGNIPKRSILINMNHTAVLVLKFLINLLFKQLGDIPNFIWCLFRTVGITVSRLRTLTSLPRVDS